MKRQSVCRSEMPESLRCARVCKLRLWKCQGRQQHLSCSSSTVTLPASGFEWPKRITQVKFIVLFSSRRHGGRTRRLCGADLHGCAVGLQNRTRRHDAPHAAEQTAAPMCISDLCRSSTINSPPTGGIGVRVLPASCVLVPKRYACAFLAQQEKPKV